MTDNLARILKASQPLTLSAVPGGFLPWLLADLARAAAGRAVFIAADDVEMRGIADAVAYSPPRSPYSAFRRGIAFPTTAPRPRCVPPPIGWRRSTPFRSSRRARRFSSPPSTPSPSARTLTPFRIRQLVAKLAPGERIDRDKLGKLLQANGYVRTDTVADPGEYAVRGGLIDLWPSGEELALRLDFFGDEIESVRRFDPADQRTVDRIDGFTLLPASEALLDEDSIKRFRSGYRERFGATATGDPLYQAISEGRRLAGMEHWLPLFEEKLATLFEHLSGDDVIVRDAGSPAAAQNRFEAITDYHANRVRAQSSDPGSYRPLPATSLYLPNEEWDAQIANRPMHIATPFREPESASVLDFDVDSPRDFTPERTAAGECLRCGDGAYRRPIPQGAAR